MATEKQIGANRVNASKSTGPKTEQGKAASCQNALTHGLLASDVVIEDEDPEDFDRLREELRLSLRVPPVGRLEEELLEQFAIRFWRLRRCAKIEAGVFKNLFWDIHLVPLAHDKHGAAFSQGAGTFAHISRYECQLQRSCLTILRELQHQQDERIKREASALDQLGKGIERRGAAREMATSTRDDQSHKA